VDVVEGYLELSLRLARHADDMLDYYYGPPELRQRVEAEPLTDPAVLAEDARRLLADLADDGQIDDEQRRRWLEAELVGLETAARRRGGEAVGYVEEVEGCFGVRPELVPEERFEAAHRELDDALGGSGDLGERFRAWEETQLIRGDPLLPLVEALTADFRTRAATLVDLPEGEDVELELVSDEPWMAYNYYLGGLRSRVVVNTDVPAQARNLGVLVAHELYPGHHTEHALKELTLLRGRGYGEEAIALLVTPQCLVSEAIAEIAFEMLFGDDGYEAIADRVRGLGIEFDPPRVKRIVEAREALEAVPTNAALMLHEYRASPAEVHAYLSRWLLRAKPFIDKSLGFISDPMGRAYVPCYSEGLRLAREFVRGDVERFRRLLTEQLVPADLAT
jgi:hypothetical protein